MSFEDGWAAINLEMPSRVPRTEYSLEYHFELIETVTGIRINNDSPIEEKLNAYNALYKAWNFDFFWSTLIGNGEFGDKRTNMGHAEYAVEGADYDDDLFSAFSGPEDVLNFDPWELYGERDKAELTRRFEDHYKANVQFHATGVNMTGVYVTCVSGFIAIFGWDLLLTAAGLDPKGFGAALNRYGDWMMQYYEALADADVPVVMVHDDMVWTSGAIFRPEFYREFVFPNYKRYFAPLKESGKRIMYTSDGNFTEFIDDVVNAGADGFVFEPTTSFEYIVEHYGQTHVIVGNADTRILLRGPKEDIRAEVERCMNLGKSCPGFFMAVGNHIPANTPLENVLYYNEVYEELSRR